LLYRAARELLTNIGKHAKATTIRVGLTRKGDRIVLTIADDGTGFDPAIVAQYVADGHIGLGSLLPGSTRWAARWTSTRGTVTAHR